MAKEKASSRPAVRKGVGIGAPLSAMNLRAEPIITFDSMLKISFTNRAAQTFFRLTERQFSGKYMVELLGRETPVFLAVENAVRKGMTVTLRDVSVNGRAVSGVIVSVIEKGLFMMVIRDKKMKPGHDVEDPLMHNHISLEKLLEEIRDPLVDIHRAARKLAKVRLSAKDRELAELILRESERIQGLLQQFNFDETQQISPDPDSSQRSLNLRDVHQQVMRIAQETYGKDIEIREYYDPALPDIRGNFDHLVQAKLNLIRNAAEAFANKKGQISIRTFYDKDVADHADDPEHDDNRPLCIEIEDNGKGITPDIINRIFMPYFTTKKHSQGLGLPMTSKIVYDHGGTIKVNSKPGKTVFRINLPILPGSPPPNPNKPGRRR